MSVRVEFCKPVWAALAVTRGADMWGTLAQSRPGSTPVAISSSCALAVGPPMGRLHQVPNHQRIPPGFLAGLNKRCTWSMASASGGPSGGADEGATAAHHASEADTRLVGRALDHFASRLQAMREAVYAQEERRHVSSLSQPHQSLEPLQVTMVDHAFRQAHVAYTQLQSAISALPESLTHHALMSSSSVGSGASSTSGTSFDQELWAGFSPGEWLPPHRGVEALRRRAEHLLCVWNDVQAEAGVLRREMVEDKSSSILLSVMEQAQELMDSLQRALDDQDEVVQQWPDVEAGSCLALNSPPSNEIEGTHLSQTSLPALPQVEEACRAVEAFSAQLETVGKKTKIKVAYYMPSADRALAGLNAMFETRETLHGGEERLRHDVTKRWNQLTALTNTRSKERKQCEAKKEVVLLRLSRRLLSFPNADVKLLQAARERVLAAEAVQEDQHQQAVHRTSSIPTSQRAGRMTFWSSGRTDATPHARPTRSPGVARTIANNSLRTSPSPSELKRVDKSWPFPKSEKSKLTKRHPLSTVPSISSTSCCGSAVSTPASPSTSQRLMRKVSSRTIRHWRTESNSSLTLDGIPSPEAGSIALPRSRSEPTALSSLGLPESLSLVGSSTPIPAAPSQSSTTSGSGASLTTRTASTSASTTHTGLARRFSRRARSGSRDSVSSTIAPTPPPFGSIGGIRGAKTAPPPSRSARAAARANSQTPESEVALRASRLGAFGPAFTHPPIAKRSSIGVLTPQIDQASASTSTRPSTRFSRDLPTYGGGSGGKYKPNRRDALDVAVGSVANALGVSIARLEPPLPPGQRLVLSPGRELQGRYILASLPVTVKTLQLHRPGMKGQGITKTMVRAEGMWQDLETWLLAQIRH